MKTRDAIKTAITSLKRNRIRTALSLLGIVIGVFSVTLVISLGLGVKAGILGYVNDFVGEDFIQLNPAIPEASYANSMSALMMGVGPVSLVYDDIEALADPRNLPYATAVSGAASGREWLRYGNQEYRSVLLGVTAAYPQISDMFDPDHGLFFN